MNTSEGDLRSEAKLILRWMKRKNMLPDYLDERIMDLKHREAVQLSNSEKFLPRLEYLLQAGLTARDIRVTAIRMRKLIRKHNRSLEIEEAREVKSKKKRRK